MSALVALWRFLFDRFKSAVASLTGRSAQTKRHKWLKKVIRGLERGNAKTIRKVGQRLAGLPSQVVVKPLLQRLDDQSPEVVKAALEALASINPGKAFDAARRLFQRDTNEVWPTIAADFLVQVGPNGWSFLLGQIRESDGTGIRVEAASRALARHRFEETLADLTAELRSTGGDRRADAILVIGLLHGDGLDKGQLARHLPRAVELLVPLLSDSDENVRSLALWALAVTDWSGRFEHARRLLSDSVGWVRAMAVIALFDKHHPQSIFDQLRELSDVRLASDECEWVRKATLQVLAKWNVPRDQIVMGIRTLIGSEDPRIRVFGVEMLGARGDASCAAELRRALRDRIVEVRKAAVEATQTLAPSERRRVLLQRLSDKEWMIRQAAASGLGECGSAVDVDALIKRFEDDDNDVREAALHAAVQLAPARRVELALRLLGDEWANVCNAAVGHLKEGQSDSDMARHAIGALRTARGEAGEILLRVIEKHRPDLMWVAVHDALRSKSWQARKIAAASVLEHLTREDAAEHLKRLTRDRDENVRLEAFTQLIEADPERRDELVNRMVADKEWEVRQAGVRLLAEVEDIAALETLLPLTRDEDEDVRADALKAVAKYDDPRVLAELISSLNDVDDEVVETARKIIGGKGPVPVLGKSEDGWDRVEAIRAKVDVINRWAIQVGWELLGRTVAILNYRQSLGRTWETGRSGVVEIQVSDTPVTTGHPHGEQIMKGLVLHELGHHLFDINVRGDRTLRGIARSEGIYHIYHLLTDERLERALRSRRPEWGVYFDRLGSYAFAQNTHLVALDDLASVTDRSLEDTRDAVSSGQLPGRVVEPALPGNPVHVALADHDMLKIPGLLPPYAAFLACLRCGFAVSLCADPSIAEAIALVPSNLKDLPNNEVLEVARRIARVIGPSDRNKEHMKRVWRRLTGRQLGRLLNRIIDRMGRTGYVPDWLWKAAANIRRPRQIIDRPPRRAQRGPPGGWAINLGKDVGFDPLPNEQTFTPDPHRHAELVGSIRRHIRRIRGYFERLGQCSVEEYASRRGRRLDLGVVGRAVLTGDPNLLVHAREEIAPDAYIGVLIDCSGSMAGEKIELAKRFGALVAEGARGLRGIEGHVNAFDDDTFYRLGDFERHAIERLEAGGGNNDAASLARAADLALRSRKRRKLLIMISDGSPTQCSVDALRNLVTRLTRDHDIVCVQAAVDEIDHDCFPRFVDLSKYSMDEALGRFGSMLIDLTREWR